MGSEAISFRGQITIFFRKPIKFLTVISTGEYVSQFSSKKKKTSFLAEEDQSKKPPLVKIQRTADRNAQSPALRKYFGRGFRKIV